MIKNLNSDRYRCTKFAVCVTFTINHKSMITLYTFSVNVALSSSFHFYNSNEPQILFIPEPLFSVLYILS